jgi:DHA1 family tetracycline resistance protein-like MFS transporter
MAIIGAAFGLGFAAGPVIGGILSQHPIWHVTPLAMPALVAALMCLANFAVALFLLPETHHDRSEAARRDDKGLRDVFPAIARALGSPDLGPPLTVFAFATFAFTAVESSFSWLIVLRFRAVIVRTATLAWNRGNPGQLFASLPLLHHAGFVSQQDLVEKATVAATTSVFTVVGVTILFTQLAVMRGLARRVGEHRLVMFGSLLLTASLVAIAFANDLAWIRVLSACIAIGNGVLNPCLSSLITQSAGPANRGAVSGAQQGLGSLARIIAPPINNSLVQVWTGIPFLASAAIMAWAFTLSLRLHPLKASHRPAAEATPVPVPPLDGALSPEASAPSDLGPTDGPAATGAGQRDVASAHAEKIGASEE